MAMSKEMRNQMRSNNTLLESLKTVAMADVPAYTNTTINEEGSTKITNLSELQNFLSGKTLSYYGFSSLNDGLSSSRSCDVIVSVYLMSTKNVKVDKDKNFFSIGYSWEERSNGRRINHYISRDYDASRTLEDFIELPKANNSADKLTTDKIVKMCDAEQIYNLYQDKALTIMRKLFTYPYHMFTGNNLYRKMEKVILNMRTGELDPVTLYVTFDPVRKKFKYAYNPDFILSAVIDEWMLQKGRYNSLIDCYTYVLAFVITHEMLHIIHHNTTNDNSMGDLAEAADSRVSNIIQDSFINCKISRRYMGADGIEAVDRLAPTPRLGIGSKITVRCEHNNGLKKFNDVKEISDKIFNDVLAKYTKISEDDIVNYASSSGLDLSGYEGADIFISIDIKPNFSLLRGTGGGSNTFQRCFNDIVRVLTDGKVHDKNSPISDAEKLADLSILPDGTLIMVKGTRDIGYVESYDSDDGLYTIVKADISGVDKRRLPDGDYLCVTKYTKSSTSLGRKNRIQIKPYNPEDDAYVEGNKPKQDKLSQQDIDQAKNGNPPTPPMPPMPPMPGQGDDVKSLKVGDIVWVRRLHKFGRITSIDNGKFTIEEVIEKPAKVIDDSNNYV